LAQAILAQGHSVRQILRRVFFFLLGTWLVLHQPLVCIMGADLSLQVKACCNVNDDRAQTVNMDGLKNASSPRPYYPVPAALRPCCSGANDCTQQMTNINIGIIGESASPRPMDPGAMAYRSTALTAEKAALPTVASLPTQPMIEMPRFPDPGGQNLQQCQPIVDPSFFEGAWEDSQDIAAKNVYVVQGTALILLNTKVSDLSFSEGQLHISGTTLSASLDATRTKLLWNDGDSWSRAGMDGSWKKVGFDGLLNISGGTLTSLMPSGEKLTNPVAVLDAKRLVIMINGAAVTGTMDNASMSMSWSDGDQWTRGVLEVLPDTGTLGSGF